MELAADCGQCQASVGFLMRKRAPVCGLDVYIETSENVFGDSVAELGWKAQQRRVCLVESGAGVGQWLHREQPRKEVLTWPPSRLWCPAASPEIPE
jgi:hypothetical protein